MAADCRREKKLLRAQIARSREQCWKQLLEEVNTDVWGKAYGIVCRRIGSRSPNLEQSELEHWAGEFFPAAAETRWGPEGRGPHTVDPVTAEEVQAAAARLTGGKAPGPSGIPPEAAKWAVEAEPEWAARVFTKMLRESSFPEQWRTGLLVLIPKHTTTGQVAYRPLCLLETVGKIYEQVVLSRLREELERGRNLSDRQYGFRPGRSTLTALKALNDVVAGVRRRSYSNRPVCAMITLDIKNAFNTASWGLIMEQLRNKGVSEYLVGAVGAYLRGRKIQVGSRQLEVKCGVPQGSVLGPTLWNIMYDPVLELAVPEGVTLLGYADDLALVGVGRNSEQLEQRLNNALSLITEWMVSAGLCLAAHKTELVVLVGSRRTRSLKVCVGGHDIVAGQGLTYLGVFIGREYRFGPHVTRVLAKAEGMCRRLARLMPNLGGPGQTVRRLLSSVANAQILYAAQIWAGALQYRKYRDAVNRTQRRLAIRIASAYRTVSGPAAMVVAGVYPLHLLVKERARLAQEENLARQDAREETLRLWQEEWTAEDRGAWTRRLIPDVQAWYRRSHGQVDFWLTQMLTGHGAFGDYLHRFRRRDRPECRECGVADHVHHVFFVCSRWGRERGAACVKVGQELNAENIVPTMLRGSEQWAAVATMAREILGRKDREDSQERETVYR